MSAYKAHINGLPFEVYFNHKSIGVSLNVEYGSVISNYAGISDLLLQVIEKYAIPLY